MARVSVYSDFGIPTTVFTSDFQVEDIARFQALDEAIAFLVAEQNKYIPPEIEGPERESWVKQPAKPTPAPPASD